MEVEIDDVKYEKIAGDFVHAFLITLIRSLHNSGNVDFDVFDTSPKTADLIFEIAFGALSRFEDHGGVTVDGIDYVSHVTFATKPSNPGTLIASTRRTDLHGNVDDPQITRALEAVRAELGPSQ